MESRPVARVAAQHNISEVHSMQGAASRRSRRTYDIAISRSLLLDVLELFMGAI
jgi:hypothetical protein